MLEAVRQFYKCFTQDLSWINCYFVKIGGIVSIFSGPNRAAFEVVSSLVLSNV